VSLLLPGLGPAVRDTHAEPSQLALCVHGGLMVTCFNRGF
jgi:hypothetical protein